MSHVQGFEFFVVLATKQNNLERGKPHDHSQYQECFGVISENLFHLILSELLRKTYLLYLYFYIPITKEHVVSLHVKFQLDHLPNFIVSAPII